MSTAHSILLDVNGIEVIYSHVILVLKGVSLQVPEGKVVALLGGNGAGKTALLRYIAGLLPHAGGICEIDGRSVRSPRQAVAAARPAGARRGRASRRRW